MKKIIPIILMVAGGVVAIIGVMGFFMKEQSEDSEPSESTQNEPPKA